MRTHDNRMRARHRWSTAVLFALPFIAIALAGARPLHALPGHGFIGIAVSLVALVCLGRLVRPVIKRGTSTDRALAVAGVLLMAPWILVALLWVGLGAPFQASAIENQHRYIALMVDALLVGTGFTVLRDALREIGERTFSSALLGTAVPATALYLMCIAITLARSSMIVQGDQTPLPPSLSHLYDALEFFACLTTYVSTALAAAAMGEADLLGRVAARVWIALCICIVVLLVLRGVDFPEISGQTSPWYTQPGVIVRIPSIPWVMPGLLAVVLLRRASGD